MLEVTACLNYVRYAGVYQKQAVAKETILLQPMKLF
jgi:hypothetical protein